LKSTQSIIKYKFTDKSILMKKIHLLSIAFIAIYFISCKEINKNDSTNQYDQTVTLEEALA